MFKPFRRFWRCACHGQGGSCNPNKHTIRFSCFRAGFTEKKIKRVERRMETRNVLKLSPHFDTSSKSKKWKTSEFEKVLKWKSWYTMRISLISKHRKQKQLKRWGTLQCNVSNPCEIANAFDCVLPMNWAFWAYLCQAIITPFICLRVCR